MNESSSKKEELAIFVSARRFADVVFATPLSCQKRDSTRTVHAVSQE